MASTDNLYVQEKNHWLKYYRSIMENKRVQRSVLQKYLTPEKIEELKSSMLQQFEELLPQLPDFGRKQRSQFSTDMVKTALSLAFYRALKEEGFQLPVIGQIIFEISEAYYGSLNPIMKFIMRRFYLASSTHRKAKKAIEQRKLPLDPEDYHCTFVEGDEENLLFGLDYTNCAGLHLLKNHNALELAPYLCLCDYPIYRAINIGFNRTQNLAIGGTACMFRWYRNYPTERGWPPVEVTEYKDFKFKE
ncbi:MAG: L-2-amino-thiazoline-4-carboxylic acid hydrolase [Candidatus Thorarchaeota archaeon]|nr:L-2-amino-thiazoline-4-carboxylic acid hydrolase [Candidatus Thorarchaeota archaeon]